ncbi:MAG: 2-oxoglutarate/2-oxoacid ferredoxin oxidoreductase subunit alpha [Candidatus Methanomethylophilaceae archaeon]|nr:2-oxoglutarate/2-oxoacid ferredoxin oxidoreductase subunit alpha [Candidatus Methanomethylophilaceae archaeon]MDI3541741.1 2-oxoglutarate/2-oxoacid ferredoxin oxidoreductase subunit alpha [Candidatus Methanomethylophilaceae archaeon]
MMNDISLIICGAAGQGIQTVEQMLVSILKMAGYHVFSTKEYESRVRGGSNSTELRISDHRVNAFVDRIDVLIPFDERAISHLKNRITEETLIIADQGTIQNEGSKDVIGLPFRLKAEEVGSRLYTNVVAIGTVVGLFRADISQGEYLLEKKFSPKGKDIVEENKEALRVGYEMGKRLREEMNLDFNLHPTPAVKEEMLINGNEAIALGAMAGGCNFISAYPMSPSTGVLEFLASHARQFGILVDQAEDEIAAINKAAAAWFAGARAIVSTSGGGFDLMTEGLSLVGMTETPLVIHLAQRPGPATGLPTRTAQEDLSLAIHAGHGEFCRLIYAPGTIQQAFELTRKAFNIADRYQIPVFILSDQYFVDSYYNIPMIEIDDNSVEYSFVRTGEGYKRYRLTENGLSPRGIPGYGDGLIRVDSDEHDEWGHITEDLEELRPAMVEKRVQKRRRLLEGVLELPTVYPEARENYAVCWGSNYHVVKEAVDILKNPDLAMMHFHQVYPLHKDVVKMVGQAEKVMIFENNATGQFSDLLSLHTGRQIPYSQRFLSYSGAPLSVEKVITALQQEGF